MCFTIFEVVKFRECIFKPVELKEQDSNSTEGVEVKKSNIPNAGNGVFATKELSGYLFDCIGEPVEAWRYHSTSVPDHIYTGIDIELDNMIPFVWRGVPHTLGATINSSLDESDSNVEFVINEQCIESKIFHAEGFVQIHTKRTIQPGEELLLYYGEKFWKNYKQEEEEAYCAICLELHSTETDVMFLCDSCLMGYHTLCLEKLNKPIPDESHESWLCFNCLEEKENFLIKKNISHKIMISS